jgi:hypothetical protein
MDIEYEIDTLLDYRHDIRGKCFLVAWKGYSPRHHSWEPAENLPAIPKIMFHNRLSPPGHWVIQARMLESFITEDIDWLWSLKLQGELHDFHLELPVFTKLNCLDLSFMTLDEPSFKTLIRMLSFNLEVSVVLHLCSFEFVCGKVIMFKKGCKFTTSKGRFKFENFPKDLSYKFITLFNN